MIKKLKLYLSHILYILGLIISIAFSFLLFQNRKKKEKIEKLKKEKTKLIYEKNIIKNEMEFSNKQKERKKEIEKKEKILDELDNSRNLNKNFNSENKLNEDKNGNKNNENDFISISK